MLLRALICLVLLIASLAPQPAPAQTGAAQPDVAGSRDPDGIDR